MGPIAVPEKLRKYLPSHPLYKTKITIIVSFQKKTKSYKELGIS